MAEGRQQLLELLGPVPLGVHGGLDPLLLNPTQLAGAVNVSLRGGFMSTRPGLVKLTDVADGVFQGAGLYRLNEGDRLIFVVSGKIYQVKLFEDPVTVTQYTVESVGRARNNGTEIEVFSADFGKDDAGAWSEHVNMVKAEKYFIVQDGYHQPAIIGQAGTEPYVESPDSARVSFQSETDYVPEEGQESTYNLFSDVPVARAMAYASGRLVVSPRYLWEDLVGTYPAVPDTGLNSLVVSDLDSDAASCLRFVETNIATGGGAIRMPQESGFVVALQPFRNSETVDGNGAVIAFCQDGVSAFNFAFDRSAWGSANQTISQMLFTGVSTYSPRSVIPVNDDIVFRRPDGLASIRYTASQVAGSSGSLSSTPLSFEISHRLNLDSFTDLPFVSISYADNLLLLTTGGRTGDAFRGLVGLDLAALYSLSEKPTPAYIDLWTGLGFQQVLKGRYDGVERHFVVTTVDGTVQLWYFDSAAKNDAGSTAIKSRVYTKVYTFNSINALKKFSRAELWIDGLVGEGTLALYWRADGYSLWKKTNEVTLNADPAALPQGRFRVILAPTEENPCDPATGRPLRAGYAFQFCVEWTGSMSIKRVIFRADPEPELEPMLQCSDETVTSLVESEAAGVVLDDFDYSV